MGLIKWYLKKRNSIVHDIQTKKIRLSSEWKNFLERDTYLTSDLKEKLLHEDYFTLIFYKFFFISKKVRVAFKDYNQFMTKIDNDVNGYNDKFIKTRLEQYGEFFESKKYRKFPLDDEQRRAIVIDDRHNLVIAGAGAGKTEVLTSKIAYLIKRQDKPMIRPEKILALAFNNKAVDEIKMRMKEVYGIENVSITTFHKFGKGVYNNEEGSDNSIIARGDINHYNQVRKSIIKEKITALLSDKSFQDIYLNFISSHLEEEEKEENFDEKLEYYEYMRNRRYTTLNNERVKSIAERDIANFFFTHNIDYEYEKEADWIKNNKQVYHPDFYLPKYDIYVENWGLDKNDKVPEWFSGKNPSEEYLKNKEWKINQFDKYKKKLVQTWDYERVDGRLIQKLMERLKEQSEQIKFERLSFKEIVEKTFSKKDNRDEINNMLLSFIDIAKANGIDADKIKDRTKSNYYSDRQKLFGELALKVFLAYENHLSQEKKIDFNDMIIKATKSLRDNRKKYNDKYDYILIDEFQDISKPRWDMIMALLECNPNTKLFCVGDDWQSIYGFAGSEIDYFVNFSKKLKYCKELSLTTNYRSSRAVVDMSNHLIKHNQNRTEKEIRPCKQNENILKKANLIILPPNASNDLNLRVERAVEEIRHIIRKGVHPNDIMVLSRFNKILDQIIMRCSNSEPKIPVKDNGEKTNGVTLCSVHKSKGLEAKYVILLDIISGTYGFPSEIEDSSIFEIAKNYKKKKSFEEERRLFYVALTRSKEHLSIFTIKDNQSIFLKEISQFIEE